MLTDALIEELRYKGEGSDLDYKSERYPFAKASDEEKSEILKDILALANTHRDGTAHILMGFKESPPPNRLKLWGCLQREPSTTPVFRSS